ncbi:MAG TPA: GNAT family N-acetyltransferase [Hyphomonadaceae bacterium]|jgi:predicted N-acetyltransferase YhbS|nr:GNAT family N-acetyltransferase [Hyphomonadaceae bacterium]
MPPTDLPSGFHIRLVRREEAALLHETMLRCWRGTVAENSSAYRETPQSIDAQLERGAAMFLFEGDAVIGCGRLHPVPGPTGDPLEWVELKRIGVLATHRKLGLGAPLVAALEAEARTRGAAGAQLGVRADQPRLIRFWSSLGYVLADDVHLHTVNPLTPPPTTMRKRFWRD